MGNQPTTADDIMRHYTVAASKVPRWERQEVVDMMKAGCSVDEVRAALGLPLMLIAQIIIEEFPEKFGTQ